MKKIFCASLFAMLIVAASSVFAAGNQLHMSGTDSVQQYYHCGSDCNGYYDRGRGGCGRSYSDHDDAYCDDDGYCYYRHGRQ